jgi:hypothetical protein
VDPRKTKKADISCHTGIRDQAPETQRQSVDAPSGVGGANQREHADLGISTRQPAFEVTRRPRKWDVMVGQYGARSE